MCCFGTSVALIRRHYFAIRAASACLWLGYQNVRHERTVAEIETFFRPSQFQLRTFEHQQEFDYRGLEGRLLSSSYTPEPEDARYASMLRELRRLFDMHQVNGRVTFEYKTRVYYCPLS